MKHTLTLISPILFLIFAVLAVTSCKFPSPNAPAPVAYKASWDKPEWTAMLSEALDKYGQDMLKKPVVNLCGDPKQFYIMLFTALANYESNLNPEDTYTEDFKDNTGHFVISRGLFQLSKESANGYGCGITDATMLHDPKTNIECAVRIANKWISQDGTIVLRKEPSKGDNGWRGMARYWSPFRDVEKFPAMLARARSTCLEVVESPVMFLRPGMQISYTIEGVAGGAPLMVLKGEDAVKGK